MARIFLTGATGYIGGDVLYRLQQSNLSKSHISCLVRDAHKAKELSKSYPSVDIIQGDLDDSDLLEKEAKQADVVLNLAATGHAGAASAITKGLKEREMPGHWIQIGGATLFAADEIAHGRYGQSSQEVHDDLKDNDKIRKVIRSNPKRVVENNLISQPAHVRTALLVVPLIYGTGRGPCHKMSIQAPEIARCTLKLGHGFRLGAGENAWSNIHIHDLSDQIFALTEAATNQKTGLWSENGIYCPENGKMSFGELCKLVAAEAHSQGLIREPEIQEEIDAEKANSMSSHAAPLWGTNAVIKSSRSQAQLGWNPKAPTLSSEIAAIVKNEAESQKSQI
ncbi:MAG: hypothetical protein Q9221_003334 [Calogaya cf. arnoldii]